MNHLIEALRRAALARPEAATTDGELLDRFLHDRDEAAFAGLVRRHGPMVLGVCRRILGHVQDAEDAFQATFLVLVRKAESIVPRDHVGHWLYGVAQKTARKARTVATRRSGREQPMATVPDQASAAAPAISDEALALERELAALPEKYRAAILLCDLHGLSRAEAAAQLGWRENTLSSRLARGRQRLAERLGHALPLGLPLTELPATLVTSTTQAASALAAGTATAGAISAPVLALMEGVLQAMVPLKLKFLAAVVLTIGLVGFTLGAGQGLLQGPKSAPAPDAQPVPVPAGTKSVQADSIAILGDLELLLQPAPQGIPFKAALGVVPKAGAPGTINLKAVLDQPNNPVPPELIRLLVKENDPDRRKQIGLLIESYQQRTLTLRVQLADVKAAPKPDPKAEALQKSEAAVKKLRESVKEKTPEAEVYDALLQAIQKLKK